MFRWESWIEYVDRGEGPVVLVVDGITQGADGGLRELAEDIVPAGYRVIVPSRFGSEMPEGVPRPSRRRHERANPSIEKDLDGVVRVVTVTISTTEGPEVPLSGPWWSWAGPTRRGVRRPMKGKCRGSRMSSTGPPPERPPGAKER